VTDKLSEVKPPDTRKPAGLSATHVWQLYEAGVEFKNSIDLYNTVNENERFFAGDQWAGVNAPDLPKPVVNFIKRACQQRVANVAANPVAVSFESVEFPREAVLSGQESRPLDCTDTKLLNSMFDADWNRMKMDALNLDGLLDAAISGDCILYNYWDTAAQTGQPACGQICAETIDNVNYYPGNPNEQDVQKQPYIIIARRELVRDVIAQAKANGCPKETIDIIAADTKTENQSGYMSRHELSLTENAKCVTLLYLCKDSSGHVLAQKSTRGAVIRPMWDTLLKRYPIAMMNWEYRKNCCHGRAEITGLIPVQRYINQMYAMAMLFTMQSACPKAVFNQGMVKAWSNAIGMAIPVNGDINSAIKYLEPPELSQDIYNLTDRLMKTTLQMVGVSEIELGSINPTNTSALVIARESSNMTIQSIKTRFYAMIEDFARNWLDMVLAYGKVPRFVKLRDKDGTRAAVFEPSAFSKKLWSVKIDVGAATAWSEVNSVQTLNTLYNSGAIDARQYIERLPDGYLPMREKLLSEMAAEKTGNPAQSI
jgi:hypothetical protein